MSSRAVVPAEPSRRTDSVRSPVIGTEPDGRSSVLTSGAGGGMTAPAQRTCLLVLGMHRSGTSALTRLLSMLGAALPHNVLPPTEANTAGHWEPARLVALHDKMLDEASSRWDDWRPFDVGALGPERLAHYTDAIRATITEEFGEAPLFVVKDPRICRFVPLYETVMRDLGVALRPVLIHRNPLAVLASLEARDRMTRDYAALLWLRHVLDAEAATRHGPRAIVSYEGLLDDPGAVARDASARLGTDWPVSWDAAAPQIAATLSRDLQHHRPTNVDLAAEPPLDLVRRTHEAYERLAGAPHDPVAIADLDAIRQAVDGEWQAQRRLADALTLEAATRARWAEHESHRADTLAADELRISTELAAARTEVAETTHRLDETRRRLDETTRRLDETESRLASHQSTGLDNDRLRGELSALRASRALRVGKWLRNTLAAFDLALLGGRDLTLRPGPDVSRSRRDGRHTTWELAGDDPQFHLHEGSLPPSRYLLALELPDRDRESARMDLYVDSGAGYSEAERFPLDLRAATGDRYEATFVLPEGAERLRLDPPSGVALMTTGTVRLRRLTRLGYYINGALRMAAQYRRTGRPLRSAVARAVQIIATDGVSGLARTIRENQDGPRGNITYEDWIARHDQLTPACRASLREQLAELPDPPLISVLMPVYNPPEAFLRAAIDSVRGQLYENWQLCIADDRSTAPHVAALLREYAAADDRIRVTFRDTNGHISRASNSALELVRSDWVALLDHDDILRPHALAEVALEIARHPDAELIYSDEDKISESGVRFDPFFKPDFSRELFRSQNYLNHLTVHRTANVRAVGGWRPGFEGSQDYDLNLRVFERVGGSNIRHIPKVLYHWRAAAGSTALSGAEKGYAYQAGRRALEEHVARTELAAEVADVPGVPFYRLRMAVPEPRPLVSLIVPTRDRADLLSTCIESIRARTTYDPYEIIIVDNGSSDPDALRLLDDMDRRPQTRVLRYDKPFNFSAINNFAVAQARGDIVGLINNDIEVISPAWLTEMVSWAAQPDIGCVGAKLYYPNDTIQHAGIILGIGGVANHAHLHAPRTSPGYFGRAVVTTNWSAVTGACLVVRKGVYEQVGGLNETDLSVAFNDVDFCLRVRDRGYSNVWTPYAELYHHESLSRGMDDTPAKQARFVGEIAHMKRTWGDLLQDDPYYSRNLSRSRGDFSFAE